MGIVARQENFRKLNERLTRGIFALYLAESRGTKEVHPTWNVSEPMTSLKDFKEASWLKPSREQCTEFMESAHGRQDE